MSLFNVVNDQAQFDAASNFNTDTYVSGIRFAQGGAARVTTSAGTYFNQGIPMSETGQVAIVDATAGLPADTIYINGLPVSGNKVCVSRNARSVVSNGLPFDSNGAIAGAINFNLNFIGTDTLDPLVTFTRASTATFFNSAGVLTSAAINAPRFDYNPATLAAQGLLIEEARTNGIRNSTMQGAVAGTPGTLPTNWSQNNNTGIVPSVVGTGVENGITYIDLRFVGTTAVGQNNNVFFDSLAGIPASPSQVWTLSSYIRLVGGSLTNILRVEHGIIDTIAASQGTISAPTSAALATQRVTFTRTLSSGAVTGVQGFLQLIPAAAPVAIDITLRIGLPQLEQGAFATSVIPTTTTALTRAADVASVNTLSPWFNSVEGTVYFEGSTTNTAEAPFLTLQNAGLTDLFRYSRSFTQSRLIVNVASVNQADLASGTSITLGATFKTAGVYKVNDFASVLNAGTVQTDTSGTVPTVTTLILGSGGFLGSLGGYIRRITYYPRKFSPAELQSLTA